MSVKVTEKTDRPEIRHSSAIKQFVQNGQTQPMPKKQPTARMKIINGRPYYYEITNVWSRKDQRCHQKSKYLGKELPYGYRLIK